MPRNNNDFVSGLQRMGQALGYYGYVPDSVSSNVKPGPAAKAANPVPFTNGVRVIEKGPTNPPTVGIRKSPTNPTLSGGGLGPMGGSGGNTMGGMSGGSGTGVFRKIK